MAQHSLVDHTSVTTNTTPSVGIAPVKTDVVIVGAGPAGASLACFLSSHGIKGILVEYNSTSADTPRAHITNMAALDCLRDIGLDTIMDKLSTKSDNMLHTRWAESMAGREYGRIHAWGNTPKRMGDYHSASPCVHCDLPQTLLEPELVRYATLNGFQIRWDTEFVTFEEKPGGVAVHLLDRVTKQPYTIEASYLFGADGARSRIVSQLGLPLEVKPDGGQALNVLVKADLSHLMEHRMGNLHWLMQPDQEVPDWSPISIARMVKPWHEWMIIMLPRPGVTYNPLPSNEALLKRVKQLIGDDTPAEILKVNVWKINETIAESYSKGHIFCLGDAVHRHPPANGLGSNTCIQDAFNLAWKVAYVLKNKAGPQLLDSYSIERRPIGRKIVTRANDSLRNHFPLWDTLGLFLPDLEDRKAVMAELGANTPAGRKRRGQLQAGINSTAYEYQALGVEMNQSYESSAVLIDSNDKIAEVPNPDEELYYLPSTRPGKRLPHVWLGTAMPSKLVSTIDLAGKGGFTIFTGVGGEGWKAAAKNVSDALGVPIKTYFIGYGCEYEDVYCDWTNVRAVEEDGCVLVRPDRCVAWRYQELNGADEAAAEELLMQVMKSILSR